MHSYLIYNSFNRILRPYASLAQTLFTEGFDCELCIGNTLDLIFIHENSSLLQMLGQVYFAKTSLTYLVDDLVVQKQVLLHDLALQDLDPQMQIFVRLGEKCNFVIVSSLQRETKYLLLRSIFQ